MANRSSAGTRATFELRKAAVDFELHSYHHDSRSSSYGLEAAQALGFPPEQVFKTLLVSHKQVSFVGIVPVSGSLDVKAMARSVGVAKVTMMAPADAERITGYVAGGISPFGQRKKLVTVLDQSALNWPTILVSAGRRGLDMSLTPDDLIQQTAAILANISRPSLLSCAQDSKPALTRGPTLSHSDSTRDA
jgi:Cys-tRNA(Pro)/Cys-tRNA(Cys) deacylase